MDESNEIYSSKDRVSDLNNTLLQKRHKKHKHKKHKKKKEQSEEQSFVKLQSESEENSSFKVKFKKEEDKGLNKGIVKDKMSKLGSNNVAGPSNIMSPKATSKKKVQKSSKGGIKGGGRDSGTSSEEERWLDAIESGKLEEVDEELKKIKPKDPKLMTARQRAMFERKTDMEPNPGVEQLMSLPTGYKEKVMTAEAIQKAALKSLKRKQLADEKREKDKKKTMERLLKKQESKASKVISKGKLSKRQIPLVTYHSTLEGSTVSLPPGEEFPLVASKSNGPAPKIVCGVLSCGRPKKYTCSTTGIPLCSLECYKLNLVMEVS